MSCWRTRHAWKSCPVGGHNMHEKVERKVRQVEESMNKKLQGNRLSILQWETLGDQIANNVNNLPLATVNVSTDLEYLDLLTPNRLLLGRNNDRFTLPLAESIANDRW